MERKLSDFQNYYNLHRTHSSLGGNTPVEAAGGASKSPIKLDNFHWQTHCRGLFQLPIAA
ncbi:MAG: transposase [Gammaproteobacteria bacterium]|nr:transposase [Gammaproteobacteria bacterium]